MGVKLADASSCTGCGACLNRCPRGAIRFEADGTGFSQPAVDASRCVECHACERVCPVLAAHKAPGASSGVTRAWAGFNRDTAERRASSSGGIFSLIAREVLRRGGIVYGVKLDESLRPVMCAVEHPEGLEPLRGSKYVQADPGMSYLSAERALKRGRAVLFSGTPCQIAGLKRFLGCEYPNLMCVSFICHGVPSPMVWADYVAGFGKPARGACFRDKSISWKDFSMSVDFSDGSHYRAMYKEDAFIQGFLQHFTMRASCHGCRFRYPHWPQDVTLADFWKVKAFAPGLDSPDGVSLVFTHTPAGESAVSGGVCGAAHLEELKDVPGVLESNPASLRPMAPNRFRGAFWEDYRLFGAWRVLRWYTRLSGFRKIVCRCARLRRYLISRSGSNGFLNDECHE